MSSQYGILIYGAPIDSLNNFFKYSEEYAQQMLLSEEAMEEAKLEWKSSSPWGFELLYNANGNDKQGFFGVKLQSNIDTHSSVQLSDLTRTVPTAEQKLSVIKRWEALPTFVRLSVGSPKVWLVWGSD